MRPLTTAHKILQRCTRASHLTSFLTLLEVTISLHYKLLPTAFSFSLQLTSLDQSHCTHYVLHSVEWGESHQFNALHCVACMSYAGHLYLFFAA